MSTGTTVSLVLHLLFAAAWTGGVLFVVGGVLPVLRSDAVGRILNRLTWLTRVSAVVTLATGAHLAAVRYGGTALTGTDAGNLVVLMAVLWLLLVALVEVAGARADGDRVGPAATRTYQLAAVVAVVLLLDAGVLLAVV